MIDVEQTLREWREAGLVKVTRRYRGADLPKGVFFVQVLERPEQQELEPGAVGRVFAHWQAEHDHPQSKLTADRRRIIASRLKQYSEADLLECISGYKRSPHHMGENQQHRRYDDIELFLRDAKHIEAGINLARARAAPVYKPRQDPQAGLFEDDKVTEHQRWLQQMRELTGNPDWQPPETKGERPDLRSLVRAATQRVRVTP